MQSFEIEFEHPDTGQRQKITAELTAAEQVSSAGRELYRDAYLLRSAYAKAPRGYLHVPQAIRPLAVH